ncbi:hypothetical protein [Oricola indica]|uniref:hypothetical protein n=1 Tax=Oricola indica TaxID=2872591 RepID=UPI003CCBE073
MSSVIVKGGSPLTVRRPAKATRISQGSKALSPPAGATGKTGGAFSFEYDASSLTMADPTDGKFRLNNATPEDATALAISAALADATDVSALIAAQLGTPVDGRLIVTTGTNQLEFEVTALADNGDWLQLTLANGVIAGTLSDEDACELVFTDTKASAAAAAAVAAQTAAETAQGEAETAQAAAEAAQAGSEAAQAASEAAQAASEAAQTGAETAEGNAETAQAAAEAAQTGAEAAQALAEAASLVQYGNFWFNDDQSVIAEGGYPIERSAERAITITDLVGEVTHGDPGESLDIEVYVDGVSVYGPTTVDYGTPLVLDALSIDIDVGSLVGVDLKDASGTPYGFWLRMSGS